MNEKYEKKIKQIFILVIGIVISGVISAYAATVINSSEVSYTSNGQSTVQGAIDDLYSKATQKVTLDGVENVGFQTNTAKTVFANSSGLCITRKGRWHCFKINNYETEETHIQQVFSDISCTVDSPRVYCNASDLRCSVYPSGSVSCTDRSDYSTCFVSSDGSVNCG